MAAAAKSHLAIPSGLLEGFRDFSLGHITCLTLEGER